MADTPISPGLIDRITQAARYVISGVKPDAWFGPLQPLQPMAPPEVAGRRFDYPTGYNLNYTPRPSEPVSFADLRALADNCDILRSVIETRKDQIEAQEWTVRVAASDTSARLPSPSDNQKQRIETILAFLNSPDREHGFHQWLRQILEDMFVIDGVAIYKRRNRAGGLYALEVMDAATIKLLLDDSGRAPLPPDPAYQQILKGVPAADYTREELMYIVHNPRSHKVYGYSHVEQVLITVNILIRRALHQLEYYRDGSTPDAFIGAPREWTADQISDFQKNFDAMLSGNLAQRRRARFLPGDFKYQEIKAPPLKDQYDEFLARVICFVFSISPEPFVGQVNRATAQTSQTRAVDEGLAPLMRFVRSLMNRIIAKEFASPDLEFAWQETRAQDPQAAAQIDVAYVGAGIMTADEVRANMGLPPLMQSQKPQAAPVKKNLRKDDNDDDDSSGGQSRWPAGSPGGAGGQFAPKDSGDATGAMHDAISQDAKDNAQSSDESRIQSGQSSPPDEGRVDESYSLDAVIGVTALEALSSDAVAALASRVQSAVTQVMATAGAAGAALSEKAQELSDTIQDAINDWLGDNGQQDAEPANTTEVNTASGLIPGYTPTESKIINEAQGILDSPQFAQLRNAYENGQPVEVNIAGRTIVFEPSAPLSVSGMSLFGEDGFMLGPQAFSSPQELQKTVLQELYRLYSSEAAGGVSGELAAKETKAAQDFADKAIKELK